MTPKKKHLRGRWLRALDLLASGRSVPDVASMVDIPVKTIRWRLARLEQEWALYRDIQKKPRPDDHVEWPSLQPVSRHMIQDFIEGRFMNRRPNW